MNDPKSCPQRAHSVRAEGQPITVRVGSALTYRSMAMGVVREEMEGRPREGGAWKKQDLHPVLSHPHAFVSTVLPATCQRKSSSSSKANRGPHLCGAMSELPKQNLCSGTRGMFFVSTIASDYNYEFCLCRRAKGHQEHARGHTKSAARAGVTGERVGASHIAGTGSCWMVLLAAY